MIGELYERVHRDKYRRQKVKQCEGQDLLPEYDPSHESQIHSRDDLIEFLDGRIDAYLDSFHLATGWQLSGFHEIGLRKSGIRWDSEWWEWIDLEAIGKNDEAQCQICGRIWKKDLLLGDEDSNGKACDECVSRYCHPDRARELRQKHAEEHGGQQTLNRDFVPVTFESNDIE